MGRLRRPVLRRMVATLVRVSLGVALAALATLGAGVPAHAAKPHKKVPACPHVTVKQSTKAAMAVFSGTVNDVQRAPRTDGVPGALYNHTVTVDMVYQGDIETETVPVQTDRARGGCGLGPLEPNTEYMFFVTGAGQPWVASGTSGTRPSNDALVAKVEQLLGPGSPPIQPTPEMAVFTAVHTSAPRTFAQVAWPGAALIVVGLLGLLVVRGVSRRTIG